MIEAYKPHPDVYDIPIKKYHVQKDEVAYLSANTWDVSAAGNYGFKSVWVNRNNSIFDNLDYIPKHQIKHLGELLDKIKLLLNEHYEKIEVNKILDPIPATDGAGVKLKRSIGVEPN